MAQSRPTRQNMIELNKVAEGVQSLGSDPAGCESTDTWADLPSHRPQWGSVWRHTTREFVFICWTKQWKHNVSPVCKLLLCKENSSKLYHLGCFFCYLWQFCPWCTQSHICKPPNLCLCIYDATECNKASWLALVCFIHSWLPWRAA